MKVVMLAVLLVATAMAVNMELPKLVRTAHKGTSLPPVNVTIGEKFSLPLPLFDTPWQQQSFKAYRISEEQFMQYSPVAEGKAQDEEQRKVKQVEGGEEVGVDYLPFDCGLREGRMFIKEELASRREEYSRAKNAAWQENQYVHVPFRSLLYILKTGTAELTAYLYNDRTLERLTTFRIDKFVRREDPQLDLTRSPPAIALSSQEDSLYLFSALGIWQAATSTVLADFRPVDSLGGFKPQDIGGVDKVLHGQEGVFVALKRLSKVFLIPEKGDAPFKEIVSFGTVKEFFPQDIFLVGTTLYVLDYKHGVYVYTLMEKGSFTERSFIPFESFGGNFMFTVYQSSLFINFNDIDGSKVVEVSHDLETDQHYLVRFIKTDDYVCELLVVNAVTDYEGRPARSKYAEDAFDSFLFLLLNFDDVEAYPFNLDPRTISQAYNAVKLKGSDVRKIFHLKLDRYLLVTNELIRYVRIAIHKPAVVCRARRTQDAAPSKYFRLALTANVSTCEHLDHALPPKRLFYEYCERETSFLVHVGDPEES
jgi:hypothetical protein